MVTDNITTTEVLPRGMSVKPLTGLKKRERSIYYRRITVRDGEMVWVQTCLLPSDVLAKEYYLSKGFRLTPPVGIDFEKQKEVKPAESPNAALLEENAKLRKMLTEVQERQSIARGALPVKVEAPKIEAQKVDDLGTPDAPLYVSDKPKKPKKSKRRKSK